jgi:hypothetical protein
LNLKRQIIYFGSPARFNDPFDCALPPAVEIPSEDEVELVRRHYLKKPGLPIKARFEFQTLPYPDLRDMLVRAARSTLESVVKDFLEKKGVTCFSERNDDLLMWSHYGGRYTGFCLEFSTGAEPFHKCMPVRYVSAPPKMSIAGILVSRDFRLVEELFCTKSEAWAYEREWRAIHHVAGTEFCYEPETLTGVYFGPDMDRQALEVICLVLQGQNEHVRFWAGERSTTDFKVRFEPFTYTPHLAAKRL